MSSPPNVARRSADHRTRSRLRSRHRPCRRRPTSLLLDQFDRGLGVVLIPVHDEDRHPLARQHPGDRAPDADPRQGSAAAGHDRNLAVHSKSHSGSPPVAGQRSSSLLDRWTAPRYPRPPNIGSGSPGRCKGGPSMTAYRGLALGADHESNWVTQYSTAMGTSSSCFLSSPTSCAITVVGQRWTPSHAGAGRPTK